MSERDFEAAAPVAFVTGAGSGIGAAAAVRLARAGARVGLFGRTREELEQVASRIREAGGDACVLLGDVSVAEEVRAACDTLAATFGGIDWVFANAGVNGVWAPIEELGIDEWRRTLDINLSGTFFTIKFSVPHLKVRGGSIVVCASVNGTRMFSNTGATAYACSKAGQVALTKMLAVELGRDRIRVNAICPGAIETNIDQSTERRDTERAKPKVEFPEGAIPLTGHRPGSAEQVAELVAFLCSQAASHVSGTEVWIDGAQSLLQG